MGPKFGDKEVRKSALLPASVGQISKRCHPAVPAERHSLAGRAGVTGPFKGHTAQWGSERPRAACVSIIKGKLFFFLAVRHSMLDVSSLARDQTLQGKCGVSITGLPGKSLNLLTSNQV